MNNSTGSNYYLPFYRDCTKQYLLLLVVVLVLVLAFVLVLALVLALVFVLALVLVLVLVLIFSYKNIVFTEKYVFLPLKIMFLL